MLSKVKKECRYLDTVKVSKIVDGDGFYAIDKNGVEKEYRLIGIDAPELKKCKKLLNDEIELRLPAEFLQKIALESMAFLKELAPINSKLDLYQEQNIDKDIFNRTLIYAFLSPYKLLNAELVANGYAKPYSKRNCQISSELTALQIQAKRSKQGIYKVTPHF